MFAERDLMVKEEQRKDYLRQREIERHLPREPARGDSAAKRHRELSGGVAARFFRLARAIKALLLALLLLLPVACAGAGADDGADHGLTQAEVAATDREYTYTTAEDVAAGRRAAERYWLMNHTIHAVAAADRDFTYTTAEAVARGKAAAEAYRQTHSAAKEEQIEPEAGRWQTWILASGSELRLPPPPDKATTKDEIDELLALAAQRDAAALAQIAYWNSGAPAYRWNEIARDTLLKNTVAGHGAERVLALMNVAIYDATIAAWDSKYTYDRPRPSEFRSAVETVIPNPASPSYPSEHAVAAGAASEVLAFLFPDDAQFFREKAAEAGSAFLLAGVQYPSDVEAGLALGQQVAERVIQYAQTDGSDVQWDGVMPSGPCHWTGVNPIAPATGSWKTWVLSSGSEFRPPPPIDCASADKEAEMAELSNLERTRPRNVIALFNEYGSGAARGFWYWNEKLGLKMFESGLDGNPPRAARAYALLAVTRHDVAVACFDAKYAYWAIRPFQLDPTFQTLFPTPNHPTYPAAHACVTIATADLMSYLFPAHAAAFQAIAQDAGESRIWAGIHFRSDVEAGNALGHDVARKVIDRAQADGSP